MKTRFFKTLLLSLLLVLGGNAMAQDIIILNMDATNNGGSMALPPEGLRILDDGGSNVYGGGNDFRYSVVCADCPTDEHLSFYFEVFDILPQDTLFIYDGPSTSSPLLIKTNNNMTNLLFRSVFVSPSNTSNTLTLRLKATQGGGNGFSVRVECAKPCGRPVPHIDSIFYKTNKDGVVYDTCKWVDLYEIDTVFVPGHPDQIDHFDTSIRKGVNLCLGDGVIFQGYGEYLDPTGWYTPTDSTTEFQWHFGNASDSAYGVGLTNASCNTYVDLDCYNVVLDLVDVNGCRSSEFATVTVRLSPNPIKTIMTLPSLCTNEATQINVGYDGGTGSLQLRRLTFQKISSRTNAAKTFIPDGPEAVQRGCGPRCYTAPVTFDEFPAGRLVQDKGDICSICVDYEHSFMGDYSLAIICPTGNKAYLKYKNLPSGGSGQLPSDAAGGGGRFTGLPYGGNGHGTWDNTSNPCDSTLNMYGVGWNYCFSRNQDYTLVDGLPANTTSAGNHYMASPGLEVPITWTFNPPAPPFSGNDAGTCTFSTLDSSDHANKTNYYMPADDFSTLVGCPLNGTWEIEVCDEWAIDNGWVFSWSMDICGVSSGEGCEYQVPIDSVIWSPDYSQSDWTMGVYRGVVFDPIDSTTTQVSCPDTAGDFRVIVKVYDSFGCEWDTSTHIVVEWTPMPYLGPDTILCGVDTMMLDARDIHSSDRYSYMWEPTGERTDTIVTPQFVEKGMTYVVEVTNTGNAGKICQGRDSINVSTGSQPIPSFDPGNYPLEGCEPFTINIENATISGDKFRWVFGDGAESTEKNPSHTYAAGTYDFKYYVESEEGCVDSLIYDDLFTVFPSPTAAFSWDPVYPTVLHPTIQLENRTNPMIDANKYFWEIQYDKDNAISFHTLVDKDPSFDWRTDGEDISGNYLIRLISRTDNIGPSGNIVQCSDTAEATIMLINDFLQFPNVVTPNGDGINDKFIIKNLVDGLAYPINSLYIYNRWGACVYHRENISSEDEFWDPNVDNSPAGTYYYQFKAKGYIGNIERNGVIEVLR